MAIGINDLVERVSGWVLKKGDVIYGNYQTYSTAYKCLGFGKKIGMWKIRDVATGEKITVPSDFIGLFTWKPLLPLKRKD